MAANTSNGNVVTMVDVNAKSSRSMSIDPTQFKSIAKAVVDLYDKLEKKEKYMLMFDDVDV